MTQNGFQWRDSRDSVDYYRTSLTKTSGRVPLLFPFRQLWHFGGYVHICKPTLLMAVVGYSGGMKTSFIECMTDIWRIADPINGIWWGKEWTWKEMSNRAVQRFGGPTLDEIALHDLYLHEIETEVPREKRRGEKLSDEKIKQAVTILDQIAAWPGVNYMLEEQVSSLRLLLQAFGDKISTVRAQKSDIRYIVIDYAQLTDLEGFRSEQERLYATTKMLLEFNTVHEVITIVASQVTKAASAAAKRKRNQETIGVESAQNFRSDNFQLALTLRPIKLGRTITQVGEVIVDKNNAGREGMVRLVIDPSRFQWRDRLAPPEKKGKGEQDNDDQDSSQIAF